MSLRKKLLALIAVTVLATVALVGGIVAIRARQAFESLEDQRSRALADQFRREFTRRGLEVTRQVESVASGEVAQRIAVAQSQPTPDFAQFVNEAQAIAAAHQLEFLEVVADDGTLISSAQWPARFGYKEDWLQQESDWTSQPAFLRREELADGSALALIAVRALRLNDRNLYIAGGHRVGKDFLAGLALPAGTRALLYRSAGPQFVPQNLADSSGFAAQPDKLQPLITRVSAHPVETSDTIQWSDDPASAESIHAIPLQGRDGSLLGILLLASSRRELVELIQHIKTISLSVGAIGIVIAVLFSGWAARRVTRPVEHLAAAAREVGAGDWRVHVDVNSDDEIGELATAFNNMTRELIEQRERLVQSERVAAWRELARRLAHELKNPLFPLQITVENLLRAREQNPAQFEEVFQESTSTLLAEISNLKGIIGRFSDFAKMPRPELRGIAVNDLARDVVKLFQAQLTAPGRPEIKAALQLDDALPAIQADPDLLHRALSNLVLNALDAMPTGGTLTVRTSQHDGLVRLEVGDTGSGLTPEECERLFTPYYTTKQHGTGLGLAIVQSVVSDHGGRISVRSQPQQGTTFCIDLPQRPPAESARGVHA